MSIGSIFLNRVVSKLWSNHLLAVVELTHGRIIWIQAFIILFHVLTLSEGGDIYHYSWFDRHSVVDHVVGTLFLADLVQCDTLHLLDHAEGLNYSERQTTLRRICSI